jgi:DNA-binding transcriptional regulator YiaG
MMFGCYSLIAMKAEQIIRLRQKLGISQRKLAAMLGSTAATVARWELGQHQPRGGYLKALKELEAKAKKTKK